MIISAIACASSTRNLPPARVVSVGDSITAGIGTTNPYSDSYRALMLLQHESLTPNGAFIKNGLKFSAVSGTTSAFMLANIGGYFAGAPGDLLVLMDGHNDPIVPPGIAPAQTAANLRGIIAACLAVNPALKTLITAPVNATAPWDIYNADFDAIEAALPAALAGLPAVTLMTPRPLFVPGDYLDGEHFNVNGCQKFAAFISPFITALGY